MSTTLVKPESNAHWYTREGRPAHDADLRRARKEILFPSVTTILKILDKPALTAWLQSQAALAALTLPRVPGETEDAFAKRAIEDAKQQSIKAAEFGTSIHAASEEFFNGAALMEVCDSADPRFPFLEHVFDWFVNNVKPGVFVEKIVVNRRYGYAGKIDLVCEHKKHGPCIIDLKTQGIKQGKKPNFYDEWLWQLVAYDRAETSRDNIWDRKMISLVINSNKPEPVIEHVWPINEYNGAWAIFCHALQIWKMQRKFWPENC